MNKEEIENKLEGICQDCVWLEKIKPVFNQLQQELDKKNKIIEETIDYIKYLKKNMAIDEYYLEKIYPEKYIDKILSKLEKGSEE